MKSFSINPYFKHIIRTRAGTSERLVSGDLYLDRNERVETFPEAFMIELGERLAGVSLNQYPELDRIYEKLSAWLGVSSDQIFITEGVSGAVKSILETLGRPDGNVVFPDPGFALYPVYAELMGQDTRRVPYEKDHTLDFSRVKSAVDALTSVIFLPNPNVPVGAYVAPAVVEDLAEYCALIGTVLVVDEVYFPFAGDGAIQLIERFENLLIARSFSKAFGAAGLRFGYVVGHENLVSEVAKSRSGYELNALTIEAALYFIENIEVVDTHIERVREGIDYAAGRLRRAGYAVNSEGSGNFFYVELGNKARVDDIVVALKRNRIHVRGGWAKPWDTGFSVAGAGRDVMKRFVDAFLDVVAS